MSRGREEAKKRLTAEGKRALDIRRACLILHVVLEVLLVVGVKLGWYSVLFEEKVIVPAVVPGDGFGGPAGATPFAGQARWLVLAAVVAFFFTSYDLVANADIQWPPLLASAFALGVCGQAGYTIHRDVDEICAVAFARDWHQKSQHPAPPPADPHVAAVSSATSGTLGSVTSQTSASASRSTASATPALPVLLIHMGFKLCLVASAGMALLSTYLTFFARRAT